MNITDVRRKLTIANRITIARILMVPVFIFLVLYYNEGAREGESSEYLRWTATVVFATACLTDALDGYIARARHERSRLGAILDPLADKMLLLSGLILLSIPVHDPSGRHVLPAYIPLWYLLLVITRDGLLIAGTLVINVAVGHVEVGPRYIGKAATVFQMALILWVLLGGAPHPFRYLLWAAAACTFVSMVLFVVDGVRQLEKAHVHEEPRSNP